MSVKIAQLSQDHLQVINDNYGRLYFHRDSVNKIEFSVGVCIYKRTKLL